MAWTIKFLPKAQDDLARLDKPIAKRITTFLKSKVAGLENPRSLGEPLHGPELGQFWKYRVGDFRIICKIQDEKITVSIIRIGHRSKIYK